MLDIFKIQKAFIQTLSIYKSNEQNHLLIDDIWNQWSRLLASVTQVTSDLDYMYVKRKSIFI